jgi:hypothetical protein
MSTIWPFFFILSALIQTGNKAPVLDEILNSQEKAKFSESNSLKNRLDVYKSASIRIQKDLQLAISKEDFSLVARILKTWTQLLSESLKDVEASPKMKKRLRALISFEIQVRKSIATMNDYKIRAPSDMQDAFDSCLVTAETIRKQFVDVLFLH